MPFFCCFARVREFETIYGLFYLASGQSLSIDRQRCSEKKEQKRIIQCIYFIWTLYAAQKNELFVTAINFEIRLKSKHFSFIELKRQKGVAIANTKQNIKLQAMTCKISKFRCVDCRVNQKQLFWYVFFFFFK